jgi:hypothetical protein
LFFSSHEVKQKRKELIEDGEKTKEWQSWNTNRFAIIGIKMPSPFPIKIYINKKMCQLVWGIKQKCKCIYIYISLKRI